MFSVYSRLLVLLLLVPALAGCGGGDDEPAAEQPQKTSETEDIAAYEVEDGGFALSVPSEWKAVKIEEVLDAGGLDALREEDPELARQVEPIAQPGSPVKFVAIGPDVQDDFATNANVYVEETPAGLTPDQYFDANVERVSEAVGASEQERVSLPAGEALRLSYEQELGSGRRLAVLQYLLLENETGYVITYTTLPDRAAEYAEIFEASARSFALL